jgi:uncharacterized membrane protein YdjX (TVP38/TMEM64 family)
MRNNQLALKLLLFLFVLLVFFIAQFYFDASSYFAPDRIRDWLEEAGAFAPMLYMFVMAVAIVVSPIPSIPLDLAAGAFFGPFLGKLYSLIGALCGATNSFLMARYLGRSLVERFVGGHINFCGSCSDMLLTKMVFISRLIPFVSFDVVSYGAGLTKISLKKFGIATFFGMIPFTFIYNYSGSILVFRRGVALVSGLVLVGLFFLVPYILERTALIKKILAHAHKEQNNTPERDDD